MGYSAVLVWQIVVVGGGHCLTWRALFRIRYEGVLNEGGSGVGLSNAWRPGDSLSKP